MTFTPFMRQHSIALDVGTAWTRAANPSGRQFSVESASHRQPEAVDASVLGMLFRELGPHSFWRPRVVAAISACAGTQERIHFTQLLHRSGAGSVVLVPQPFAAALGAGLDPGSEHAQMIGDIGESFTEYAVIRSGSVLYSRRLALGCGALKQRISRACGRQTSAATVLRWMETHSLDDLPPFAGMISGELARELRDLLQTIADGALSFFRELPDPIACEVIESGIMLVGGGALIADLRREITRRTLLGVRIPGNPITSAIEGVTQVIPYAGIPA